MSAEEAESKHLRAERLRTLANENPNESFEIMQSAGTSMVRKVTNESLNRAKDRMRARPIMEADYDPKMQNRRRPDPSKFGRNPLPAAYSV